MAHNADILKCLLKSCHYNPYFKTFHLHQRLQQKLGHGATWTLNDG